ncbi:MAG TPA: SPOR domain-containing protein [Stellaceae bacterium]|nr:SPOR domain-containing protein [Stellaceae bacterium]
MPAAVPAASPSPPFVYSVQAGSFLIKENAERLAAELTQHGYAAQVLVAQSPGEPTWYPVVLAPVGDVATVARQAQEFTASEGRNAEVVSWLAAK